MTAFEISVATFPWSFAIAGLPFIVIGAVIILIGRRRTLSWNVRLLGYPLLVFASLWTLAASGGLFYEYWRLSSVYSEGRYAVVEGTVRNLQPMPYAGKQDECFEVATERFCYSDFHVTSAFHQSASHGGPIREGLPVRTAHHDGAILRLEVAAQHFAPEAERAARAKEEHERFQALTKEILNQPLHRRLTLAVALSFFVMTVVWFTYWPRYYQYWFNRPGPVRPYQRWTLRAGLLVLSATAAYQLVALIAGHAYTGRDLVIGALYSLIPLGFFFLADRPKLRNTGGGAAD